MVALERLTQASHGLIEALDAGSAAAVEDATLRFSDAVGEVRAVGGWHSTPELVAELDNVMKLADAARARLNYLTDINRRRFEMLCAAAGVETPVPAYDRKARLRA